MGLGISSGPRAGPGAFFCLSCVNNANSVAGRHSCLNEANNKASDLSCVNTANSAAGSIPDEERCAVRLMTYKKSACKTGSDD